MSCWRLAGGDSGWGATRFPSTVTNLLSMFLKRIRYSLWRRFAYWLRTLMLLSTLSNRWPIMVTSWSRVVALLWDSACCAAVLADDGFWTLATVCCRKEDVDVCWFWSWSTFCRAAFFSPSSHRTSACSACSCRIPAESGVWVWEGGTCSLSFHAWDGPSVNRRMCKGTVAITSTIPSEVPEEGVGSRIFC